MINLETLMPQIIYGTAWKENRTDYFVEMPIQSGFRAIDTANQPKHYSEALVGKALLKLFSQGLDRQQIFLQTKFTPIDSQDSHIPYDPSDAIEDQVLQSFQSSLQHLQTSYVDSYLLHGPYGWPHLSENDWLVWQTLENLYQSGQVKLIGVSNFNVIQLKSLFEIAEIKPMIIQNRCFANKGWDREVREFCMQHNIIYQGFSLLTANLPLLSHPKLQAIAECLKKTPAQVIFRFAKHIGILPLTGTTDSVHMKQDLSISEFNLLPEEINLIEQLAIHGS